MLVGDVIVQMVQRDRRHTVVLVHNVSDVTVHDVIASDSEEHPKKISSNVTDHRRRRPRRISLVCTPFCVEIYQLVLSINHG